MITTVTLNAAIDKTYYVSSFLTGQVNRVRRMYSEQGGKGINVAKVLHTLGINVTVTGLLEGLMGNIFLREFETGALRRILCQ